MPNSKPTANELKRNLEAAQMREKQLTADLIPARNRLASARAGHPYGRVSDDELRAAQITVQSLERQQSEATQAVRQLRADYESIYRWETGKVHDEIREGLRNFI